MVNKNEIISKIKLGINDCHKIIADLDKHKAKHLIEQIAHAGFHEVHKYRKQVQKRIRLVRVDARKRSEQLIVGLEKFHDETRTRASQVFSSLSKRVNSERSRRRGRS